MPDQADLAYSAAKFLYTSKQQRFFSSWAGLLLNPRRLLGHLPTAAKRMNHYNSYVFQPLQRRVAYSRARLVQGYGDPTLTYLNSCLCDASRGSLEGALEYLGYQILEVTESECVKRGDSRCVYEFTWLNRPYLRNFLQFALLFGGSYALLTRFAAGSPSLPLVASLGLATGLVGLMLAFQNRRTMDDALKFQDEVLRRLSEAAQAKDALSRSLLQLQKETNEAMSLASLGEMSYSMVHDMASPTTLLMYYSESLQNLSQSKYPRDEEMNKFTTAIERSTAKLSRLLAIFRRIARSDSASELVEVDVKSACEDCLLLFDGYLKGNSVEVETSCGLPDFRVRASEGVIEAILLNLVQNALNAMKNVASRKLTVTLEPSADGLGAVLTISDSGPGIPRERLESLWQRFGSTDAKRSEKGSGFGLYSIKRMADRIGAALDVETGSSGTSFRLRMRASGADQLRRAA